MSSRILYGKNSTAAEGDVVLCSGNQIVIFYGSNPWSYTRIGKMEKGEKFNKYEGDPPC